MATSQLLSVQRDDNVSKPPPPPDYSTMSWQNLLPHAGGAKGAARITDIDRHIDPNTKQGTGAAPTFQYTDPQKIVTTPPSAAPQGTGGGSGAAYATAAADLAAFEKTQSDAIAKIVNARAKIPPRTMGRSPVNRTGYDYSPDVDTDPVAQSYNTWAASALPEGVASKEDFRWRIFKALQPLEGQSGRVTTFDKTLSVGVGFSSSAGAAQLILGKTMDLLPEVKDMAVAAGLIMDVKGKVSVVDTDRKWILDGDDAVAYVQTSPALLSFIVNTIQGAQPSGSSTTTATVTPDEQRQIFLNVQWKQFLNTTMTGMTPRVTRWPMESTVLAAHAKHGSPDAFPYTFWDSHPNPDLKTMATAIFARVKRDAAEAICDGTYAQYRPPTGSP